MGTFFISISAGAAFSETSGSTGAATGSTGASTCCLKG